MEGIGFSITFNKELHTCEYVLDLFDRDLAYINLRNNLLLGVLVRSLSLQTVWGFVTLLHETLAIVVLYQV